MKHCARCGSELTDGSAPCPVCGYSPADRSVRDFDPCDHTAEYDRQDIADNKLFAMLIYLTGAIGIVIALLASGQSPYIRFHVRQCVKLIICELLVGLLAVLLVWTFVVPILGALALIVLLIVNIICFVRVCKGQVREAPIVCLLDFLR